MRRGVIEVITTCLLLSISKYLHYLAIISISIHFRIHSFDDALKKRNKSLRNKYEEIPLLSLP